MTLFQDWYQHYPHKVGKRAAETAFVAALKRGVRIQDLHDGLKRYIETKPDWQRWCHPSVWLNQDRWADEPATEQTENSLMRSLDNLEAYNVRTRNPGTGNEGRTADIVVLPSARRSGQR